MKCRALQLLAEGRESEKITEWLSVSKESDRWFKNYEFHGQVDPYFVNQGRRRLLTQDVIEDLRKLLLETPDLQMKSPSGWVKPSIMT